MYVTASWSVVYAIDARTGKQMWKYDPKVAARRSDFKACCDVVNRGVALYKGKVYVGALDGRLVALDAKTGKVVWETARPSIRTSPTRSPARRASSRARSSSATAAPSTACAATCPPTTPRPASRCGASTPCPAIRRSRSRTAPMERAAKTWNRRRLVEVRRRRHGVGRDRLRSRAQPALHRHGQRLAVEPQRAQPGRRRQSLSRVDRRAQRRHRRVRVALPDDARRHLGLHRRRSR